MDSYLTPPTTPDFPVTPNIPCPTHEGRLKPAFPYHIDDDSDIIYKITEDDELVPSHTHSSGVQGSHERKKLIKWAEIPQTPAFHYDWTLQRMASEVRSTTLKEIIHRLISLRDSATMTHSPLFSSGRFPDPGSTTCAPRHSRPERLLHDGTLFDARSSWDYLLMDALRASRSMQERRKWKDRGRSAVAGWCQWGRERLMRETGEFVKDVRNGITIDRHLPATGLMPVAVTRLQRRKSAIETEGTTWSVNLGYRRHGADRRNLRQSPWDSSSRTSFDRDVAAWYDQAVPTDSLEGMLQREKVEREQMERLHDIRNGQATADDPAARYDRSPTRCDVYADTRIDSKTTNDHSIFSPEDMLMEGY